MNEALDAGLNLDKCAEVHEPRHSAGDALACLEAVGRGHPGLGLQLLETKRYLLGLRIDFEDADLKFLADR